MFQKAGAAYVVLTAKHTDGYLLWPSKVSNLGRPGYQSTRDLVGEFATAMRARGLRAGLYYTGGMDWLLNPDRIDEPGKIYSTILDGRQYVEYANAHWRELIGRYHPAVIWGDIMYPLGANTLELFSYYYNRVPDGVINDRFATRFTPPRRPGLQPPGIHYDFKTPEYTSFDEISSAFPRGSPTAPRTPSACRCLHDYVSASVVVAHVVVLPRHFFGRTPVLARAAARVSGHTASSGLYQLIQPGSAHVDSRRRA